MTTTPTTDPQAAAQAVLTATPTGELLTKAYALTHRVHEAEAKARPFAGKRETMGERAADRQAVADLRAARDLITAEVLRRTGGQ